MTGPEERTLAILAAQRAVRASDDLRARLRAELLSAPVVLAVPTRRPSWLRSAVALALIVAVALGGTGVAAASSLPGEPAFVLKQAVEEAQLALAADDAVRASVALQIAERRLAELRRAGDRPELAAAAASAYDGAVARVAAQVDRLRRAPPAPARDEALERARDAGSRAVEQLQRLEETLPLPALPGIERAIERHEEQKHKDAGPNAPARTPKPERTARPSDAPGRGPASPARR